MPIYDYKCDECGTRFEALTTIADRALNQCQCGCMARQVISPVHFDPRMGVDPDFPTAAAAWDKKHRKLANGTMRDPNATAHGTTYDVEKDQHKRRQAG